MFSRLTQDFSLDEFEDEDLSEVTEIDDECKEQVQGWEGGRERRSKRGRDE